MAKWKNRAIRTVRVKKSHDLQALYAKARATFTAADLQRYTETEEMFPAEQLVKELEAIHRLGLRSRKEKKA